LDLNRTFGWSLDPHKVQAAKNRHYNRIKKEEGPIRAIAKIKDIVLQYYGQLPMAVGTGSIPENALEALSHIGLDTHFITLVTARDVVRPKPNPEVFLRCAAAMQIEPRYCQVYEDGEMGFLAARNAQMILTDIEKEITTTPPY
jgi:HAD superfamily hydrolase (TIGR01509 family)